MGFFDAFTGKTQRQAVEQGHAASSAALKTGYDTGRGDVTGATDRAVNYLSPYAQSGQGAMRLYGNALGANGAQAQGDFYSGFQHDPGWMAQQQAGINALDRSAAVRGGLYSGAQQKALFNYGQQGQRTAYNDRLTQLAQLAGMGQGAAGQQAGYTANSGNMLANLAQGYGQNTATNEINYANARAQAANIGPQNIMNALGTLGGMAISAFAPGAGGMTAAGNMGNALMRGANGMSGGSFGFPTSGGWSTNPSAWRTA
jgi:hypothetical protein